MLTTVPVRPRLEPQEPIMKAIDLIRFGDFLHYVELAVVRNAAGIPPLM